MKTPEQWQRDLALKTEEQWSQKMHHITNDEIAAIQADARAELEAEVKDLQGYVNENKAIEELVPHVKGASTTLDSVKALLDRLQTVERDNGLLKEQIRVADVAYQSLHERYQAIELEELRRIQKGTK